MTLPQELKHFVTEDCIGQTDEQLTRSLENFFSFHCKGSMSLQEYSLEWDLRFEEAHTRAGLDINMVGRSFLWLKHSGMSQKFCDDLKLQEISPASTT